MILCSFAELQFLAGDLMLHNIYCISVSPDLSVINVAVDLTPPESL